MTLEFTINKKIDVIMLQLIRVCTYIFVNNWTNAHDQDSGTLFSKSSKNLKNCELFIKIVN